MASLKEKQEFYRLLKSGKFAEMIKESVKKCRVQNSEEVYNVVKPLTAQEPDVEQFWVLFLDAKNSIMDISMMFKGSITSATVYPRELIKKVLATKAVAIICCHNHPSGDPEPSPEDYTITFQIFTALKSIGVTLHEHIIIGAGSFHSMADHGIMSSLNSKYDRLIKG
jgi:DNA repair protein RadC